MAKVNTEITVPCYILITWGKKEKKKDFSVAEQFVDNNCLCNHYHNQPPRKLDK